MSLLVCRRPSSGRECGLRLVVVVDALDGRRCWDTTNHAESGTPSERWRYTRTSADQARSPDAHVFERNFRESQTSSYFDTER